MFSAVQPILHARVPIIKVENTVQLGGRTLTVSADVSMHGSDMLRDAKSGLLRLYTQIDDRVQGLVWIVKVGVGGGVLMCGMQIMLISGLQLWAMLRKLHDASMGRLNSYSLALMTIQYLQCCEPPILPCLQVGAVW